jgi:hypothetical protein
VNEFKTKALLILNSKTTHFDHPVEIMDLKRNFHKLVEEMRQEYIPVRTNNIIAQAISMDVINTFKGVMHSAYLNGYIFLLNDWTKLSGHLQQEKQDTTTATNARFIAGCTLENVGQHYFITMDQTAVGFELKSKCIFAQKGERSVCARDSGSDAKRCGGRE